MSKCECVNVNGKVTVDELMKVSLKSAFYFSNIPLLNFIYNHTLLYPFMCTLCFVHRNLVRVTKSSQLESVDPSHSSSTAFLGKLGKDFEFSQLGNKVEFAESSANTGDDDTPADIKPLQEFISRL